MKAFFAGSSPIIMLDETSVFDIGACVIDGIDLAPGRAIPDDGDVRIDHSLEGFLFTCGPDHIRPSEPMEHEEGKHYPLHGSYSSHSAKIISFELGALESKAVAEIPVIMATGQTALLTRRWHMDGLTGVTSLLDRLENTDTKPFAPMHMYHRNVGARWLDDSTRITGRMLDHGSSSWRFGEGETTVFCVPAEPSADAGWAELTLGPISAIGGKSLVVRFSVQTLPHLQMWRNQIEPAHILGIEPASHAWLPRTKLHERGDMITLAPGAIREYRMSFAFS